MTQQNIKDSPPQKRLKVKVVGAGGIGGWLLQPLSHYLCHQHKGASSITVTVIDGDNYEDKNRERQVFKEKGNKATIKCDELRPVYPNIWYTEVPAYLSAENIKQHIREEDTVMVCVDNHATRKLISLHAQTLSNVTVISGGNELIDGNVQTYIRREGKDVTPSLEAYQRNIANPPDANPADRSNSCQNVVAAPQLVVTNLTVATCMLQSLYNVLQGNQVYSDIEFDIKKAKQVARNRSVLGAEERK